MRRRPIAAEPGMGQLVAHLAHVEVLVPDPAEAIHGLIAARSLAFVAAHGRSTYLRGSADALSYSLKITEAPQAGVGHVAWRCTGPGELHRAVAALAASGRGLGWTAGDLGHGAAYRFQGPSGHIHELLWEAEPGSSIGQARTALARLDHVTLGCALAPERDAAFFVELLGLRRVDGPAGTCLSTGGPGYEVAFVAARDAGAGGLPAVGMRRAQHVAGPDPAVFLLAGVGLRIAVAVPDPPAVSPAFP